MESRESDIDVGRRNALKTVALATTAGGLATAATRRVAAQSTDLQTWFDGVDNYDGVVDATGAAEVTVEVGVDNGGMPVGFGPAAVRVDPGTAVTWEWTGEGGQHDVVAADGAFEGPLQKSGTFEHVFDAEGVSTYVCTPHEQLGMRGAVVVGGASVGDGTATAGGQGSDLVEPGSEFDYGEWFEGVDNFDGTVDARGRESVSIEVGADGNGGALAFEPAAVWIDPGTVVTWEWTGEGGQHNVYDEAVGFESPMHGESDATYALQFDGDGVVTYACAPHEAAGMKGAVVVGNPAREGGGVAGIDPLRAGLLGLAGAIVASPYVAAYVLGRRHRDRGRPPARPPGRDRSPGT